MYFESEKLQEDLDKLGVSSYDELRCKNVCGDIYFFDQGRGSNPSTCECVIK